jgi:hypothetical protein
MQVVGAENAKGVTRVCADSARPSSTSEYLLSTVVPNPGSKPDRWRWDSSACQPELPAASENVRLRVASRRLRRTAFARTGSEGWYVLETNSLTKDIVADTRANIEFVKKTFRVPPGAMG